MSHLEDLKDMLAFQEAAARDLVSLEDDHWQRKLLEKREAWNIFTKKNKNPRAVLALTGPLTLRAGQGQRSAGEQAGGSSQD